MTPENKNILESQTELLKSKFPSIGSSCIYGYGVAIVLSVLGIALLVVLKPLYTDRSAPLILLALPVAGAAFFGGTGPGLLATLLCGLGAWGWVIPPAWFAVPVSGENLRIFLAVMTGIIISLFSGSLNRANRSLRLSEQQLRALADSMSQLAWIARADGFIIWYNQRWYEYTGTTHEQMEGWGWQSVHDPNMLPKVLEQWKAAIAAGKTFEMEFPLRGADGTFKIFLTRGIPFKDSQGHILQWFGTNTDISQRAEKEKEALHESELEFRSLAESMPQIVWVTRPDGWNIYFNQQWVDYTGLTLEESYGHGWNKPFHPDDRQLAWEAWQRATRYNEPYSLECRLRRADGSYRWWLIRGAPMRGANGEILKWFGTCTDIDEIKHARIELEAANELLEQRVAERTAQLEQSNRELEQFTSIASHDLKEPLRMVTGFVELLAQHCKDSLDDKAKEYISFAVDGAKRMSALITALLTYSRAGGRDIVLEPTNVDAVLGTVLINMKVTLAESAATVTHDPLPAVRADAGQITQVLMNLIGNAIKFRSPDRPCQVHVSAKAVGNEWVFSIRDNGIGIDPQYKDRIFMIFERLPGREEREGAGIGLAICKKIVDRHGGRIWIESEPGKGTTFYFTIPNAA